MQNTTPKIVGNQNETSNHLILFVSLKIVKRVVAQGKCKIEKTI